MSERSSSRRFQLWFLIFTAAWLIALVVGVVLAVDGLSGPLISDSPERPWQAYSPGSAVWGFGFGLLLVSGAIVAVIVDGVTRLIVLFGRSARRPRLRTTVDTH